MNHSLAHLARSKLHSWQDKDRDGCADVELMCERLQQLRLDPNYIKICCPSVYRELERVCASCKLHRLCAQDLASGDVESGMRSYCPNAPTIDALTVNWVL